MRSRPNPSVSDANPVIAAPGGATIVDARIRLAPAAAPALPLSL
jgi:hypothetical protein